MNCSCPDPRFAKLAKWPLFRRVTGRGKGVGPDRPNDNAVARLVKSAALAAGLHGDLGEDERAAKFSGHSLRAGLASSAEVDERHVQKQLGHASAEMTRKYQRRRDRLRGQSDEGLGAVGTLSRQHTCEHISDVVLRAVENCRDNDFAAIFYR